MANNSDELIKSIQKRQPDEQLLIFSTDGRRTSRMTCGNKCYAGYDANSVVALDSGSEQLRLLSRRPPLAWLEDLSPLRLDAGAPAGCPLAPASLIYDGVHLFAVNIN